MSEYSDRLFDNGRLLDLIEAQRHAVESEIGSFSLDQLLNTSQYDLAGVLEEKYSYVIPLLIKDDICVISNGETKIDVRDDPRRYIRDTSQPFYILGTYIEFEIPFIGDGSLLRYQTSTFTFNPPSGKIVGQTIRVRYETTQHDGDAIKKRFTDNLTAIQKWLNWVSSDVSGYNASLREFITANIETRKNKLLADRGLVASLGFPVKKREGMLGSYVVPVRKKITVMRPSSSIPFKPEPVIEMQQYEDILKAITDMSIVMERSPSAFRNLDEEALRDHLLVPLNNRFEGPVSGETFNYAGKTDILIRADDRNVFIGECKFWKGPKVLAETVDQILGYASWRDTKTAIIMFNRNKRISAVLEQIPDTVKKHTNFKRPLDYPCETGFRFVMHHNDDVNRELTLTVIVMEVPT